MTTRMVARRLPVGHREGHCSGCPLAATVLMEVGTETFATTFRLCDRCRELLACELDRARGRRAKEGA